MFNLYRLWYDQEYIFEHKMLTSWLSSQSAFLNSQKVSLESFEKGTSGEQVKEEFI